MLCQNCGKNEATIHLYATVNGQRTQLDYCQSCYQKIKNQQNGGLTSMAQNDPFGFGSLDDLFRSMSRQMQQQGNMEQTPPTQFGGNNNFNGGQPPQEIQMAYSVNMVSISQNKHVKETSIQ